MNNHQLAGWQKARKPVALVFCLLLFPVARLAQNGGATTATTLKIDQLVGTYKGTAKRATGDMNFTLEIKVENGKTSGRMFAPQHDDLQINSSEITGNKLTLKLSNTANSGTLVLQPRDGKLVGEWQSGGQTGAVELTKEPSAAEVLTGEWDAVADAQGQAFPFTLTLKVDGDKVTGGSSSQLGNSSISTGSWKEGKLVFVLDGSSGQIAMMAALEDGKLVGDFDFAGQMQGKWVAIKKKP